MATGSAVGDCIGHPRRSRAAVAVAVAVHIVDRFPKYFLPIGVAAVAAAVVETKPHFYFGSGQRLDLEDWRLF